MRILMTKERGYTIKWRRSGEGGFGESESNRMLKSATLFSSIRK